MNAGSHGVSKAGGVSKPGRSASGSGAGARAAITWGVLVIMTAGIATAKWEPPTDAQQAQGKAISPRSTSAPTPTAAELGKRVGDALRKATSLQFTSRVTHLGKVVEVHSWMRPDALRLEASMLSRKVYAVSIVDGEVNEYLAAGGPGVDGTPSQSMVYRYPASSPVSIDNANACNRDFGCMIGSNLTTWIGPQSTTPKRFEDSIAKASQPELVILEDGREAYFSHLEVTVGTGDNRATVGHSYYVDPATNMVLRWETFQQNGSDPRVLRIREYSSISTEPAPADFAWVVRADQFPANAAQAISGLASR